MDKIGKYILTEIFCYLPGLELRVCSIVCKLWHQIIADKDETLWRPRCASVWNVTDVGEEQLILCTSSWKRAYLNIIKLELPARVPSWKNCSSNTGGLLC